MRGVVFLSRSLRLDMSLYEPALVLARPICAAQTVLPGVMQHQPEVVSAHPRLKAALTRFTIEFGDRVSDI